MKKFLAVVAMAAVVAFAAPAFAATNPFMDVPQGHWAYDAVAQLAASGVVSGYPDGAFKGAQPATRYEMASVVARALTKVDAEKASKQDLATLKKLVMEFKDELDKLGVKVDKIDKRVAVLEKNLGGWKLNGTFWFDARFAGGDTYAFNPINDNQGSQNQFNKTRFRLFLSKQINENTSFYAQFRWGTEGTQGAATGRGDLNEMRISHIYVDTKLWNDFALRVGRFAVDFEDEFGLYTDNDALFGDFRADGFKLAKSWGNFAATALIVRNAGADFVGFDKYDYDSEASDYMTYVLNLAYKSEKWFLGATGYWYVNDNIKDALGTTVNDGKDKAQNYAIYAGYNFTPAIALKGVYYWQKNDVVDRYNTALGTDFKNNPTAWKLILDIKQEALKVTSLWVEYTQRDNTFFAAGGTNQYALDSTTGAYAGGRFSLLDANGKSKVWFIKAQQKWNDKWSSFLRFTNWDYGTDGHGKDTEWGLGIGYQYNPAVKFELAYDKVNYGDILEANGGDEHVIRFRTSVNF